MKISYAADHPIGQLAGAGMSTCVQNSVVTRGKATPKNYRFKVAPSVRRYSSTRDGTRRP